MIVKPVQYQLGHYQLAEPALRRWDLIAISWVRVALMAGLLLAWFMIGDRMADLAARRVGAPMIYRASKERIYAFLPYLVWVPAIFWGIHRARVARRKAWFEQVQASGVHEAEFGGAGVALRSDSARYFYRWDGLWRLKDRPKVMVLFLNRAMAMLIPKEDFSAEEAEQILNWKREFVAKGSLIEPPPAAGENAMNFRIQADYRDYREVMKLERIARTPTSLVVRRWVAVGIAVCFVLGIFVLSTWSPGAHVRDAFWFWNTLGTPLFLITILLYSLTYAWLLRWMRWRNVRTTMTREKNLRVGEDGVEVRSEVEAHFFGWRAFIGVQVGKRVIDLRLAGGGTVVIPLRQTPMESTAFVEYLRRHVVNVTQAFPVEMAN